MIRLHDFELSGSCYTLRFFMNVLGVEYERINVDFVNKEHKSEAFLRINPLGEIPVLDDGNLRLRDAQACLIYLARKYDRSGQWFPDDAAKMGKIAQWLSVAGNEIMASAGARLVKILNYDMDLERLQARAHGIFKVMDAHLRDRQWLETDRPTIADIACFPYTAMAGEGGISLSAYQGILGWIERVKRLPGFISMPGIPAAA
jgi:glutathione S-transferase